MTPEGRYIVHLAHAFLSSEEGGAAPLPELNAEKLLELMYRGRITASLGPQALKEPGINGFRKPLELQLRNVHGWSIRLWIEVSRVCQALHDRNLGFLLLKGPALALSVYPNPKQRASSDIDILVAREDIEAACGVLEALGFRLNHSEISASRFREHHFHWVFRSPTGIHLDLHWDLAKPCAYFEFDPRAIMERAQTVEVTGVPVRIPSDLDQLLHAASQAALGAFLDLRRALDCALLLKRGKIDEARLAEQAHRHRVASALWSLLAQQSRLTGVAVPPGLERALRPGRPVRLGLTTLARPGLAFDYGDKPTYKTPFAWSLPLCAPGAAAAARAIGQAVLPGVAQYLGYRGSPTQPPHPVRRGWTALKLGAWLVEGFCSLCWRALRGRPAR